jgi:hypothetical protein
MLMRVFVALVILVAMIVGIFSFILRRDQLVHLIVFRDFFETVLPILAFGALVKYLCTMCRCGRQAMTCHHKKD